jgi:hypothetical protein
MMYAKTLLLGSAALLVSGAAARSADLPLAEPVEYVRVCDTWGAGFFYIPGTQTCLQISGYVRADLDYVEPSIRSDDAFSFGGRARLNFDARSQTEFGTLRSYLRLQADYQSEVSDYFVDQAFVQFAGLTAGRATSFFDFYANANVFDVIGGSDTTTSLLGYTATFGTISASISVEDRSAREFNPQGTFVFAGQTMPDVVANIRIDQAWGAAQLSGAVHQLRDNTIVGGAFIGTDEDYGFALQAGVSLKLPMLGESDLLTLQAAYADGALAYLGLYNQFGVVPDEGTIVAGPSFDTSNGFLVVGEFLHYWTPNLRSVAAASYAQVDATNTGVTIDDYEEYTVLGSLIWSPVKDLDLGLEVLYTSADAEIAGVDAFAGSNDDAFKTTFRVQRQF